MGLFDKIFGTRSERELKKIRPIADKVLALENTYAALSEEERALEERKRLQIQQAQAAIERHRKELEEQSGAKKEGSIFDI